MGPDGQWLAQLSLAEDLHSAPLLDQSVLAQLPRPHRGTSPELVEPLYVDEGKVLLRGILETPQLRQTLGDRGLAPLEAEPDLLSCLDALGAGTCGLATPAAFAAPDPY